MPKLLFITSGVPGPGLMSGPVHLRVLRFLSRHFDAICASYSDDDTSHIARFYRLPHRAWWWPPGRLGLHPLLRARKIISDLGIGLGDLVVVAYPFDGLVLAPILKRLAGCNYTVLVHDLHKDVLDRDEVRAGLAGASSILCASDALAELMKAFNPNSRVLFPSPGDPLNQVPAFSNGPIALAGGFNARYLMLAKKLGIPVVAIGESPGGDHVDVTFIPRFAENDEAVRFVSAKCSSVAVIVPNGHADYASHSFPSKLLDFARAGLPIIIIAPLDSPVGRWAKLRDWPLFIADEDDNAAFDQAAKVLSHEAGWLNAQRHVLAVASGEFSADAIHEDLLGQVNTMALKAGDPLIA